MVRMAYTVEHAKIQRQIDKLQKQQEALLQRQRKPAIEGIVKQMRELGISPSDIAAAFGEKAPKAKGRKVKKAAQPAAAPAKKRQFKTKYRHPESGETWTGLGRAPRWLVAAELQGQTREEFLVE